MIACTTYQGNSVAVLKNLTGDEVVRIAPSVMTALFKQAADPTLAAQYIPGCRTMVDDHAHEPDLDDGQYAQGRRAEVTALNHANVDSETRELCFAMLEQWLIDLATVSKPYMSLADRHNLRAARIDWNLRETDDRMRFINLCGLEYDYIDRKLREYGYLPQIEWRDRDRVAKSSKARLKRAIGFYKQRHKPRLSDLQRASSPAYSINLLRED